MEGRIGRQRQLNDERGCVVISAWEGGGEETLRVQRDVCVVGVVYAHVGWCAHLHLHLSILCTIFILNSA